MLPQSRTLENRNHMNAIPSPLSRPFIDASSGPDLGRRSDADAEGGAFGRLMRQQAMESAESKTAPRGGSSGSVPARSVARVGARDDSVYGEPGSPALADAGDAPNAAEAASDSQSDLVWDTHTPLEKPAKEDLPVDTAAGTGPGPAPTVPVYLMAIGATAESVQTISCAKPESLSALSIDMRAGPLPRTVARTAAASGGLSVDTATGTNPSPAPTLRSPPLVLGEATDAMQPTVGAAPESQGTPSSDGRTAPLPQTVARAAAASGGLPIDAAAGTNPGPTPTLRSPSLVLGEATEAMQPTVGAAPESGAPSSDGRTAPLPRTVARTAAASGGLPVDAAAGTNPSPAPTLRSPPLVLGEATDAMQPTVGAAPESQGTSSSDGRTAPLPRTVARAAAASGGLSVDTATGTNPSPAPTLRSPPLVLGEATEAMQPTVGVDPESGAPSSDGRTAPLPQTVARAAAASGGLPIDAAAGTNPSPAPTLRSPPLVLGEAAASMQSTSAADPAPAFRSSPLGIGEAAASMQPRSGADANDLDSPKPASTPEIGSISAQIQRLMHAGVDPVRTDGWGVVAPAGADATSQLNAVGTTPPSTAQMSTPAGAPGWGDELAQRTLWLVGQRGSVAELRLDPPELGSLEIRIRQKKDATSISFVVQSSSAREAVESTLPRLRELFAEAGLSLQSMDVSERQSGARRGDEGDRGTGGDTGLAESRFADGEPAPRTLWRGRGLIDTYA